MADPVSVGGTAMEQAERLAAFEQMLADVQARYGATVEKMAALKAAGRQKSATYQQLLAAKLNDQNLLALYRLYGLIGD